MPLSAGVSTLLTTVSSACLMLFRHAGDGELMPQIWHVRMPHGSTDLSLLIDVWHLQSQLTVAVCSAMLNVLSLTTIMHVIYVSGIELPVYLSTGCGHLQSYD